MKLPHFKLLKILISFSIFLLLIYIYILIKNLFFCSNYEIESAVKLKLCDGISSTQPLTLISTFTHITDMNLCSVLCANDIQITCLAYHLNKPFVFIVDTNKSSHYKFVVKSIIEISSKEDEEAYWTQVGTTPYIPTLEELKYMMFSHISSLLGRSYDSSLNEINITLFRSVAKNLKSHKEFWKLLDDHEFLTAYLFQSYRVFPRVYGICRHFYAVEYAQPLISSPILPLIMPWKLRVTKSIELLQLIKKFQTMWIEPLHLCDMKPDHFGWNDRGEVLFLDLDSVVTESFLTTPTLSAPNCSSDEDCSYFDCLGECLPSKLCSGKRYNTNLMTLCHKIFLGNSDALFSSLSGLLTGNFFSKELKNNLESCSTNKNMSIDALIEVMRAEYDALEKYYELK